MTGEMLTTAQVHAMLALAAATALADVGGWRLTHGVRSRDEVGGLAAVSAD